MGWDDYGYPEYVPVAQRLANGAAEARHRAEKQGREPAPVKLPSRKIATTFWGRSWCDNLESYRDYANRLPRGATYVRNGSVVDLVIKPKLIEALVAGSETYSVEIKITALPEAQWTTIKRECSASIDSLLDLLSGKFSDGVMKRLTRQKEGLFPAPSEIKLKCSCPDGAYCCKHVAAVMYGVGARLDHQPELLFKLRGVDHHELVSQAVAADNLNQELGSSEGGLDGVDLGAMFGIELGGTAPEPATSIKQQPTKIAKKATKKAVSSAASKKTTRKKAATRKKVAKPRS